MPESFPDQLSRVRLMASGDSGTWDLSPNDLAALTAVLSKLDITLLLNAEMKRVDAPRLTLELLVRLGFEMECLSISRCAELLGEDVVTFRERGWVQSRIRDALTEADLQLNSAVGLSDDICQILKDFE